MKVIFFNLLLFFVLKNTVGQVSGKVTTPNGQPVTFVSVILLKSTDSSFVKGSLTNKNGDYSLGNIKHERYILRISSTGYQVWNSPVFELTDLKKTKDFGTLVMKENAKELEEVVVRSEKPLFQQRPEGIVVNVENSILTKGSTALQVLERSPGVTINHRDNSINLNGKNGVMVMLNGKLIRMSMEQVVSLLNGMSADDISTIELLTTPPAKYDAEGSAGLINIVLKKNKKQGTNGSVSVTGGYGLGEKGNSSFNLSNNNKNINLYSSYTFSHNRAYSELFITSTQNMPFLGGEVAVLFLDTTKLIQNNHDATVGIDVKLNSKTTIGGSITYNNSNTSGNTFNNAGYNVLPDSLLQFIGSNKGINHWNNLVNSVYLEKAIRKGEKININLDYLYFNNNGNSEVHSSFIDKHGMQAGTDESLFSPQQQGFANTKIQVGVAKLDYTKQLSKKVNLETGIKANYTQNTSVSGIESLVNGTWTSSDQTSNNIIMKEGIGGIYASLNSQINPSSKLVIGARYEYSYTSMYNPKSSDNIANRKLGSLFPNIFFSKKINAKSELQVSYSKRISRPSYNDLASYVGYSDPTAVYTGNPFLKPTITNNLKVDYTYKSYSFSLLFSRDENAIARYQLTESPAKNILYISPQNLVWQNNMTLQTNLPLKINSWWTMNYSFAGGLRQYKENYTINLFEKTYFGYSLNFSQLFKMPDNFSAELSGLYNNTSYNGTVKTDDYGTLNMGIKKVFKNDGGSLQLSITDLFRNMRFSNYYGALTEEAFSIKSHVTYSTESAKFPIIKLTYSWSFGSGGMKIQKKENDESKDERDRIRKD